MTRNLSEKTTNLDIIIRFSSLGDIVLCSAFMEKLKKSRQQSNTSSHVVFATHEKTRDIVSSFESPPHEIWGFEGSSLSVFFKSWQLLNSLSMPAISHIRVFDLHGVPKSFFLRLATSLFCVYKKISYSSFKTPKKSLRRLLSVLFKKDLLGSRHIYQEHQKLIKPSQEILLPKLKSREKHNAVRSLLIAPDSQHWKKKWPIAHWESFFLLAQKEFKNTEYTLVGGADVFPQDFLDQLKESFGVHFKNRLGRLPLSDLSRIASEHDLTICGNSAWQHISESVGVPVVSLPGPIVRGFGFSPFLARSRELEIKLDCRPCTRHGGGLCHKTGDDFHACMKHVSPELVLKNVKELLL